MSETLDIFARCLECRGYLRENDTGDLCAWCHYYALVGPGWIR